MRSHSVSERRESPLHGLPAEGEEEACLQRDHYLSFGQGMIGWLQGRMGRKSADRLESFKEF